MYRVNVLDYLAPVVKGILPVDSQTCCWMVVQSVQNLRTQLSQVFM